MKSSKCISKFPVLFLFFIYFSIFQNLYSRIFDISLISGLSYAKPLESIYDHYQSMGYDNAKHIGSVHPLLGINVTVPIHTSGSVFNHYGNASILFGDSGNRVEIGDLSGGLFYHFREFQTLMFPVTYEARFVMNHFFQPSFLMGADISYILNSVEGVGNSFPYVDDEDIEVRNMTIMDTRKNINNTNIALLFGGGFRIKNNIGIYLQQKIGLKNIITQPLDDNHQYFKKRITSIMLSVGM